MRKLYTVLFNQETDLGVFGISMVDMPAMETQKFIALNKQDVSLQCAEIDRKEYTLLGAILTPDKAVFRKDPNTGEEFYITFPKETIRDASHMFIQNGYQKNSTLEHQDKIEGVSIVESWIVKDPKNDTANAYGLTDLVEGQWVGKMKCQNKEIYEKALKGEVNGFSIDGLFNLKEINIKSDKMELSKITEAIKEGFLSTLSATKKEDKKEDVSLLLSSIEEAETVEALETIAEGLEADTVEAIAEQYDAKKIALAKQVEEAEAQAKEDESVKAVVVELTEEFSGKVEAMKLELSKEIDTLKEDNKKLLDSNEKLMEEKGALEIKLSESSRLKLTPKEKEIPYAEMTNHQKLIYNRNNN